MATAHEERREAAAAFAAGVVVNVLLGFVLSVRLFAEYWRNLARH